jgi:hypothetical protein
MNVTESAGKLTTLKCLMYNFLQVLALLIFLSLNPCSVLPSSNKCYKYRMKYKESVVTSSDYHSFKITLGFTTLLEFMKF